MNLKSVISNLRNNLLNICVINIFKAKFRDICHTDIICPLVTIKSNATWA